MTFNNINLLSLMYCFSLQTWAGGLGSLNDNSNIVDNATICFSLGIYASLTGLDDLTLVHDGSITNGQPGARYTGHSDFHLSSNGQVKVIINGGKLYNNTYSISPIYTIDNGLQEFVTEKDMAHESLHRLNAEYQIKTISQQHAGDYTGEITLTVTPEIGGLSGCGASTYSYPDNESWGTMMWEDLYPNEGDADYNDLVVQFRIVEEYGANDELETIVMDFVPVSRGAGYNHSFGISLDGQIDNSKNIETETTPVFIGEADVAVTYTNLDTMNSHQKHFSADDNITIFNSTLVAMGDKFANVYDNEPLQTPAWKTRIEIDIDSASATNINGLASGQFNYRPFLHVNNTNNDIDLFEVNQYDNMISENGYPFGLLVPTTIAWPSERTSLESVYPYFEEYRLWLDGESESISDEAMEWYAYPDPDAGSDLIFYEYNDI